jgi:hypothetical protein
MSRIDTPAHQGLFCGTIHFPLSTGTTDVALRNVWNPKKVANDIERIKSGEEPHLGMSANLVSIFTAVVLSTAVTVGSYSYFFRSTPSSEKTADKISYKNSSSQYTDAGKNLSTKLNILYMKGGLYSVKFADGRKWFGEVNFLDKGMPYGYGKLTCPDGSFFIGERKTAPDGSIIDFGFSRSINGTEYYGESVDARADGFGIIVESNGQRFGGKFKQGQLIARSDLDCGFGSMLNQDGHITYRTECENKLTINTMKGLTKKLDLPNGNTWAGETSYNIWENGQIPAGFGKITDGSNYIFFGESRPLTTNTFAFLQEADGITIYVGEMSIDFKNGSIYTPNGWGILSKNQKAIYAGKFIMGMTEEEYLRHKELSKPVEITPAR